MESPLPERQASDFRWPSAHATGAQLISEPLAAFQYSCRQLDVDGTDQERKEVDQEGELWPSR
jgi:hypothetical protein